MLMRKLAVVSESKDIELGEVARVSAALHTQAARDLAPVWHIFASVHAYAKLEDVPIGCWPIIIRDDIKVPEAAGIHEDEDGQPFALVSASSGWSLTASHEMVEMLVDPFGRRMAEGQSPKPGQERVRFLVEPCDPSEDEQYAYSIDGVTVSDFYTPHFFKKEAKAGEEYSLTGAIKKPRDVLNNGYLSWHDPVSGHWWQKTMFNGKEAFPDLGKFDAKTGKSPRREIYDRMRNVHLQRVARGQAVTSAHASMMKAASPGRQTHADVLHDQILRLYKSYKAD